MNVNELVEMTGATPLALPDGERRIKSGCVCDLMSFVIANAPPDAAWVTVHANMNVIAVAVLARLACVIIPCGRQVPYEVVAKAAEEGVNLLSCGADAFAICGAMYSAGITGGRPPYKS